MIVCYNCNIRVTLENKSTTLPRVSMLELSAIMFVVHVQQAGSLVVPHPFFCM